MGLALLLTRTVEQEYLFLAGYVVLQFVVLATAWNILGGIAGYVNFGSAAFFATGAYASVALQLTTDLPLAARLPLAALAGAGLGLGVGALTLRLRGVFFSIATVAVAVICETAVFNWPLVGGARGVALTPPPVPEGFATTNRMLFVLMTGLAVLAVALARGVQHSRLGHGLRALRDSEEAAEASGVPTLRLKLAAAALSGALMALAGAPYPLYMNYVEPASAFGLNTAVSTLAMPLVGGTAAWQGPVLGALLLGTVQQTVSVTVSSELNVLATGVLLVAFVAAAPDGLLGLAARLRTRWRGGTAGGAP